MYFVIKNVFFFELFYLSFNWFLGLIFMLTDLFIHSGNVIKIDEMVVTYFFALLNL